MSQNQSHTALRTKACRCLPGREAQSYWQSFVVWKNEKEATCRSGVLIQAKQPARCSSADDCTHSNGDTHIRRAPTSELPPVSHPSLKGSTGLTIHYQ